ncbi:hypothetical protein TrST_g7300 [Triparma strigata]|uniref:Uncharacterized protein n=1 Tax=Triparma strigata TaxID=1606541 RepID=A0A9W7BUW0_9STRA|nr:hypothetical protein TrST_g7300 [Triparma strigata]
MNMKTLGVLVGPFALVGATVHYANDHPVLFNFISNYAESGYTTGNNIIDNGDSVGVWVGTFSGAPYAASDVVYWTNGIYFSLICSGALHSCVFDGSNSRRIMTIGGTGGGTMTLAGVHFKDGNNISFGGALYILSSALVSLQGCRILSNQANYGGGIYAGSSGTTVNLYSTSFDGNTATGNGDDIYGNSASLTVHSTCPPDWSGTPAAGSNLDTYSDPDNPGTLSGTTKSFDIG